MDTQQKLREQLAHVGDKATWAQTNEESARAHLVEAETIRRFWDELSFHLTDYNPASVLLALRRNSEYTQKLRLSRDPIVTTLEEMRADALERAREDAKNFGRAFPEAIRQAGIEPDKLSRHPRYTFRQGFIRVELDEREFTAKLVSRDGEEILLGMDVRPLVERLVAEEARIFRRQFQPDQLLRSIYTAYSASLKAERRSEGDEIPLRRVTSRLAKNLNRFAADEFNVDLAQLIKCGKLVVDGRRMHLNHTRQIRQGMLLHGLEEGGYVGFISFKKEEGT
jgi:hypothetical protein